MTLAYLAWVTVCIVWGTTYLAIRVALETVPVLLLAGIRWLAAGALLSVILVALGRRLPGPRAWAPLLLLAVLMNVLGNGLVVWAELYVASGLTAVVVATVPFWLVLIEACLPKGERFSAGALAGLVVGFVGILVLVWPELTMGGSSGRSFVAGVVALQLACAAWAIGTSYTKRHKVGEDPFAASAVQMMFSGTILLGVATMRDEWNALHFTMRSFSALAYLTIAGSLVAYTAYVYAVKYLPLSTVSLYAYINPVLAVLLGSLLLDEPFSLRIIGAAALVLGGIWVVSRTPGSARQT
ncbi:MAG: EamA family transporter [Vicinamibacterales bacterium]